MSTPSSTPYQLRMFDKSLKKRQKVDLLCRHLGDVGGRDCLLVSCGDNNGAMNYKFREHGGKWTWADAEPGLKAEMEGLLGEAVHAVEPENLPFEAASFDVVVAIDVHEHLKDPTPFTDELKRVVRPGGRVIATVPNGNSRKLACRIKSRLGMTPEFYGHERWGYDIEELSDILAGAGLEPVATSSYARFFTEMVELAINFAYVKVLKKDSEGGDDDHAIAPGSEEDLRGVEKSFRMYSMAYPVLKTVSMLDALVFFTRGYAVVVEATAPTASAGGSVDG
jgi:SAM-dependent methyltransferase